MIVALRPKRAIGLVSVAIRVTRSVRAAALLVAIEGRVRGAFSQHVAQGVAEVDGVLDAGIHSLTPGGAMHVCGVPGEQHRPAAVGVGDAVVHSEPGGPYDLVHPASAGSALVEQRLHVWLGDVLWCRVDGGDDAVVPAGEGRDDDEPSRGEEQLHLLR